MTRYELVNEVRNRLEQKICKKSRKEIDDQIRFIFDALKNQIVNGGNVEIRGFGRISLRNRNERIIKNPKTGKIIKINDGKVVFFRAGKKITEYINDEK